MELRPTTDGDVAALHAVFVAALGELFGRHGFAQPSPPLEAWSNQQRHLLRTGTSVVADDGRAVVGFGASFTRGEDWFLASLFVAPDAFFTDRHGQFAAMTARSRFQRLIRTVSLWKLAG